MSTTASASPSVVRTSSSSRRAISYGTESPQRTQPTSSSSGPPSASLPQRANSHSQPSSQQTNLIHVARNDHPQSNLVRPDSSRRSTSIDRYNSEGPLRQESTRDSRHRSQRPSQSQPRQSSGTSPPVTANGVSQDPSRNMPPAGGTPRRRTTVEAQTGVWSLGKTIGAGSMGRVKLARNAETGEQVAIKIVPRQSTDEHRTAQDRERADHSKEVRTAREAAIVTLVNHPYICGMRDVVLTNYHWYMLFEYVNGGQMLDYIISHGRLKEKQARKFARQIASALDYCHRNSIVHRDLKIENILISKTGDIKIIDFGLSNLFSPKSQLKTFCGSLYFAAPELLQAKQYTGPEVDVWSFGIVLYVLVCGKVPFDDQSMPQLHAKIKKGNVDYPPWLSSECKHIISRMLVTEPRNRASLAEIMNHPWITKGFHAPPENFLPHREPLHLPLDPKVIEKMTGFDFGSSELITTQLTAVLESEDYQRAVRQNAKKLHSHPSEPHKRTGVFDFYQRRKSATSRDTLASASTEAVQWGDDPIFAFNPLISIYYLVREKQERERMEHHMALTSSHAPQKHLAPGDIPAPEAAHTNPLAFETGGEVLTVGRSRPRARTHGEDEIGAALPTGKTRDSQDHASSKHIQSETAPAKKEGAAMGLLRRFSTRKHKDIDREKPSIQSPPAVAVSGPDDSPSTARKSFSVRRTREAPPSAYHNVAANHQDLLSPPGTGDGGPNRLKGLGRSTSVNSGDLRRRWSRRETSEPPETKPTPSIGSEKSSGLELPDNNAGAVSDSQATSNRPRISASRAKSMGHNRRESMQARRAKRDMNHAENVPEEPDKEIAEESVGTPKSSEHLEPMKPIYLKGLFSVSTTSNKPLPVIRADIIRILNQIGVDYREMKGGFSCRHLPSIDLHKVKDHPPSSTGNAARTSSHQRKISFGGFKGNERDDALESPRAPPTPRTPSHRRTMADSSYDNSEDSEEDAIRKGHGHGGARAAGETTTQVQSDLGQSMVLKFEILVVKVPFLSLHGLQFKKVDGGTWQYKKMAETILHELRL